MKFLKILLFNTIKYLCAFTLVLFTSMMIYETAQKNVEESLLERTGLQIHTGLLTMEENMDKLDLTAQTINENDDFFKTVRQRDPPGSNQHRLRSGVSFGLAAAFDHHAKEYSGTPI